jgi:hypothetical protein
MKNKRAITVTEPRDVFSYNEQWLGVDIRDYELEGCEILWIEFEPDKLSPFYGSASDLENRVFRLGMPSGEYQYLSCSGSLPTGKDLDTVRFGLDLRMLKQSEKDLSTTQYLLIPLNALEVKIPGFELPGR